MTERTVQVPVSLIKRAVEGLLRAPGRDAVLVCGELHALLSQPTPTAERFAAAVAGTVHDPGASFLDALAAAEPPRIEDLAPGTTFRARTPDGVLSHEDRLWMVTDSGYVFSTGGRHIAGSRIDPSTIRDVRPPA